MNQNQLSCNIIKETKYMFGLGHWEIILILVIILIIFGAGKLPKVAGELAKGIKSFKAGLKEDKKKNDEKK